LLKEGLVREEPRKKRKRKPYIRYERSIHYQLNKLAGLRREIEKAI